MVNKVMSAKDVVASIKDGMTIGTAAGAAPQADGAGARAVAM